jgi:hypothetical protein
MLERCGLILNLDASSFKTQSSSNIGWCRCKKNFAAEHSAVSVSGQY